MDSFISEIEYNAGSRYWIFYGGGRGQDGTMRKRKCIVTRMYSIPTNTTGIGNKIVDDSIYDCYITLPNDEKYHFLCRVLEPCEPQLDANIDYTKLQINPVILKMAIERIKGLIH